MSKLETKFQNDLIDDLERLLPGSLILKNDPTYCQGIPDILVLYQDKWALLECKKSKTASHQPNQDYYIDLANKMSFARFIYPENREEVINDLLQSFGL